MIGITLFLVAALIAVIWIFIEVKRVRHKMFAIFLIALIIFAYLSFALVTKNYDVDLKTVPGVVEATKIYFSWLGSIFGNVKSITTNAVKMDWSVTNSTE